MRALVTGAAGILGAVLLRRLPEKGLAAVGVSRRPTPGGVRCDLSDEAAARTLFAEQRPDLVIHSAAYSDVDGCEKDPAAARASNALSTKHLARACSASGTPLIYVSTDYVFDGTKREPYLEDDPVFPINIYGLTKLEGEHYARACSAPAAVVRTSWLFGPGNPANFVHAVAARLRSQDEVRVLDDQVDAPTSAEDLAGCLALLSGHLLKERSRTRYFEVFQVCNEGAATRLEMAREMASTMRLSTRVDRLDRAQVQGRLAVRPAYGVMSPARFEKRFGVKMRPWRQALAEYLAASGV